MESKLRTTERRINELEEENARLKKNEGQREMDNEEFNDDYNEILEELKVYRGITNM